MTSEDPDQRADRALRAALRTDEPSQGWGAELGPEFGADRVRRRLRRRRAATGALTAAAVVILGAVTVPRLLTTEPTPLVAGPPTATSGQPSAAVEPGWRIEQYRFVTVQVPDKWGYAYAPGSDWCADSPKGQPTNERQKPYVSLGGPMITRTIGCPAQPDSLLTEHVELSVVPASRKDIPPSSERSDAGWWSFVRLLTADDARVIIKVVSKDRELAERIANSAVVGGGRCAPTSPVQRFGTRAERSELSALGSATDLVVCQYDVTEPDVNPGGLRAARSVSGPDATALADSLAKSLTDGAAAATTCAKYRTPLIELATTVQFVADGRTQVLYVTTGTCIDPADANTAFGGVDDGDSVRQLTPALCRQVVQPPIRVDSWGRGLSLCER